MPPYFLQESECIPKDVYLHALKIALLWTAEASNEKYKFFNKMVMLYQFIHVN